MKLRNKKTGKIINAGDKFELASYAENGMSIQERHEYNSLSELCEEWEDYKPSEPLIKDEKIRKAVRFKAEALADAIKQSVKEFIDDIAELCGEEEERRLTWETTRTSYCDKGLKEE